MSGFRSVRDSLPDITEVHPRLASGLDDVAHAQERIYTALIQLLTASPTRGLYRADVLMWSIGNRSLEVADGFVATFRRWNVHAAASLVRLQVDNVVRSCLLCRYGPWDEVEDALLEGEPLHRVADPTRAEDPRARLNDTRLVELAKAYHPWLEHLYQESSRWVHLSDRHHNTSFSLDKGGGFHGSVPIQASQYPHDLLVDVLWAAKATTEAIADYFNDHAPGARAATVASVTSGNAPAASRKP